ncbi:hypothetical protein T06_3783 [Trichinella sp. T6]|nr:hypothetical protein T06_3783 [Trichinella sp. T6]
MESPEPNLTILKALKLIDFRIDLPGHVHQFKRCLTVLLTRPNNETLLLMLSLAKMTAANCYRVVKNEEVKKLLTLAA